MVCQTVLATTQDVGPCSKEGRLVLKNSWNWIYHSNVCKDYYFWDVMPCSPAQGYWRFGGTECLHHQGRRVIKKRKDAAAKHQLSQVFQIPSSAASLFDLTSDIGNRPLLLYGFFLGLPWKWRQFVVSKRSWISTELLGVTFQQILLFTGIIVLYILKMTSTEVKKMWIYTPTPHTPSWCSA
jgi:hypothetical protein